MGWSDAEFWAATPRKYYAQFYTYCVMKNELIPAKQETLIGKDAVKALQTVVSGIR